MASGKTTVGRELAQKLNMNFIDCDEYLEQLEQNSIKNIFNIYGESYFRNKEKILLEKLLCKINTVISTGGGIILSKINRINLKKLGKIVFLDVHFAEIKQRLKNDASRPLNGDEKSLKTLYEVRYGFYEAIADIHIKSSACASNVCDDIISAFNNGN